MIRKKYLLLLVILPIFLLSLTTINISAPFPAPWVKVYVDQPLGYLPFVASGTHFQIKLMVVTSGFADASTPSIVGWGLDFRVNPDVISINTTAPPPPPFPPPPPDAKLIGAVAGYVMYDYAQFYGWSTSLLPGTADPITGYWDEMAEIYVPLPSAGWGDYMTQTYYTGPAPLVTIDVTSKSNTRGSLIDLIDVEWLDASNTWHPVDVVIDGYYGTPPIQPGYPSATGSGPTQIDLTDPINTTWHELYPHYSNVLTLTSWVDNGDGVLSASDQIDLVNHTDGWLYWYHVDAVTTTIHWTFKPDQDLTGTADAEPDENNMIDEIMRNPIGSYWHQIYPDYSRQFKITDWEDTNGDGVFSPSDQFQILYEEGWPAPPFPPPGAGPYWVHLDAVSTDLIWSFKDKEVIPEFPLGLGLMIAIAPAIPIAYLWRLRKKVVAK